ncbi:MAG: glycosyltransferase [Phycisphaeraceae bacterium]|nr:glycosyltransferase [Phycisphaeraceae bacterium]
MKISVLIPSLGSPDRLSRCFDALAAQSLPGDDFEVLYSTAEPVSGAPQASRFRHIQSPANTIAARRNALLASASHNLIVFLSDDVSPLPDCLEHHRNAHEALAGKPALVMGAAPSVVRLPDRLLDRVARETSLVSTLDQMERHSASAERDWTFRNAHFLNTSLRRRDTAGMIFDESPNHSEYAELEWTWRVTSARSMPLVYRPLARVRHDHRVEPDVFLGREHTRGMQAYRMGRRYPRFSKALFGRDVCQADELRYSRAFVEAERGLAEQLRQELFALADVSAISATSKAVESIFHEQSLLKRWTWRLGLIAAATSADAPSPVLLAA